MVRLLLLTFCVDGGRGVRGREGGEAQGVEVLLLLQCGKGQQQQQQQKQQQQ